jgi:hypothetical protein
MDDSGSRAATTSMLATVRRSVEADGMTFEAASMAGPGLSVSILAGITIDTPMVMAVIATAAGPKARRRTEFS